MPKVSTPKQSATGNFGQRKGHKNDLLHQRKKGVAISSSIVGHKTESHLIVRQHVKRRITVAEVKTTPSGQKIVGIKGASTGRHLSAATKAKISASLKGRKHPHAGHAESAATRAKISASLKAYYAGHPSKSTGATKGHKMSASTKAKISAGLKRYYATHPAAKAKARKYFFYELETGKVTGKS